MAAVRLCEYTASSPRIYKHHERIECGNVLKEVTAYPSYIYTCGRTVSFCGHKLDVQYIHSPVCPGILSTHARNQKSIPHVNWYPPGVQTSTVGSYFVSSSSSSGGRYLGGDCEFSGVCRSPVKREQMPF